MGSTLSAIGGGAYGAPLKPANPFPEEAFRHFRDGNGLWQQTVQRAPAGDGAPRASSGGERRTGEDMQGLAEENEHLRQQLQMLQQPKSVPPPAPVVDAAEGEDQLLCGSMAPGACGAGQPVANERPLPPDEEEEFHAEGTLIVAPPPRPSTPQGGDLDGDLRKREALKAGSIAEVYSASTSKWFVAIVSKVGSGSGSSQMLTLQFVREDGNFLQKTMSRSDMQLAPFGTNTRQMPPGFERVASQSRQGQFSYLDPSSNMKFQTKELAWQHYFQKLLKAAANDTEGEVGRPNARDDVGPPPPPPPKPLAAEHGGGGGGYGAPASPCGGYGPGAGAGQQVAYGVSGAAAYGGVGGAAYGAPPGTGVLRNPGGGGGVRFAGAAPAATSGNLAAGEDRSRSLYRSEAATNRARTTSVNRAELVRSAQSFSAAQPCNGVQASPAQLQRTPQSFSAVQPSQPAKTVQLPPSGPSFAAVQPSAATGPSPASGPASVATAPLQLPRAGTSFAAVQQPSVVTPTAGQLPRAGTSFAAVQQPSELPRAGTSFAAVQQPSVVQATPTPTAPQLPRAGTSFAAVQQPATAGQLPVRVAQPPQSFSTIQHRVAAS